MVIIQWGDYGQHGDFLFVPSTPAPSTGERRPSKNHAVINHHQLPEGKFYSFSLVSIQPSVWDKTKLDGTSYDNLNRIS